jgi:hypothetical protein
MHKHLAQYMQQLHPAFTFLFQKFSVLDSENIPVFAFALASFPPEISFLTFPLELNEHHHQFFVNEGPFCAGRGFLLILFMLFIMEFLW